MAGARACEVVVPATSANLGPGYDSLGLAVDIFDRYTVELGESGDGIAVDIRGEGCHDLPTGADHLVASSFLAGMRRWDGGFAGGARFRCANRIPQGRGLGSSSAAIVGGLMLASAICGDVDRADLLVLANELEGHPDNVAPAILGGLTIAWTEDRGADAAVVVPAARAVSLAIAPQVRFVLFVPKTTSPTHAARAALPALVPHADAARNAGRAALVVAALTTRPDLLLAATEDRLHQEQRRATYPDAMALVDRLRGDGVPAVISGAGPAVLAMSDHELPALTGGGGFSAVQVRPAQGAVVTGG